LAFFIGDIFVSFVYFAVKRGDKFEVDIKVVFGYIAYFSDLKFN
jgi:hypothetical protein